MAVAKNLNIVMVKLSKKKPPIFELYPKSWTIKKVPEIVLAIFGIIFYNSVNKKGKNTRGHKFTQSERDETEKNSNILKVLNSNLVYTEAFNQQAICEHDIKGKSAKLIFTEPGIPDWLNEDNMSRKV